MEMFIRKQIADINIGDIHDLIADPIGERKTIDYKKDLFLDSTEVKNEFRRDCTSFANTQGGDLLIGIEEEKGLPVRVSGVEIENIEKYKLRLEELLQSHIKPRIVGHDIEAFEVTSGKYVVLIRIPASPFKPHQVAINSDFQFWARNSAGKFRLDVDHLRSIIMASEINAEKIRSFRADRVAAIYSDSLYLPFPPLPKFIVHLIPLSALLALETALPPDLGKGNLLRFLPLVKSFSRCTFNADGYITYVHDKFEGDELKIISACQLFYNGSIELIESLNFCIRSKNIASIQAFEKSIAVGLPRIIADLKTVGTTLPLVVCLSIVGAKGWAGKEYNFSSDQSFIFTSDLVQSPEVTIHDEEDLMRKLKPALDRLWNAAGLSESPNYIGNDKAWKESN